MKSLRSFALLGGAALLVLGSAYVNTGNAQQAAKGHEFIGSKACMACHKGPAKGAIFESWEKSAHATALSKLPAESQKDPKCLPCHSTGFGKPGGFNPAAATNAPGLDAVGCEACHGAGKDYKVIHAKKDRAKSVEAGLVVPSAATCKSCHEGAVPAGHKALPKFDYAAAKTKIEHHVPKK